MGRRIIASKQTLPGSFSAMSQNLRRLGAVSAILCLLSARSGNAEVTLPNLPAGTEYQLIFMTDEAIRTTGTMISEYNSFVATSAMKSPTLQALASSDVEWRAIASTFQVSANINAPSAGLVFNTAGQQVASTARSLYSGTSLFAPVNFNQYGNQVAKNMATGSDRFGNKIFFTQTQDGGPLGYLTYVQLGNYDGWSSATWLENGWKRSNDGMHSLYALSSVITTPLQISVASGVQTQSQTGYPVLSGAIPFQKVGGGTLVLDKNNSLTGRTTVQGGRLRISNEASLVSSRVVPLVGGTLTLSAALKTTVGGLDPNAGGLTDVGNGLMTVATGLSAADVTGALFNGRDNGSWLGARGITSSRVVADNAAGVTRAVGWLDNGDASITVAYAAPGDTNLDWRIDVVDAANFVAGGKFDTGSPANWSEGDFNYDGVVDIQDAADFSATGLYNESTYNAAASFAAVPEPGTTCVALAGLTYGGYSMFCRRRAR
jgi:autotransporter-associated beta strand protein